MECGDPKPQTRRSRGGGSWGKRLQWRPPHLLQQVGLDIVEKAVDVVDDNVRRHGDPELYAAMKAREMSGRESGGAGVVGYSKGTRESIF